MSLFISDLAFAEGSLLDVAKVGILVASLIAGIAGWSIIRITNAPSTSGEGEAHPN
jgi:NhaA family Na+:H+ antiporter